MIVQGWRPTEAKTWQYEDSICPYCGQRHEGNMKAGFALTYENATRVFLKAETEGFQHDANALIISKKDWIKCDSCGKLFAWAEKVDGKFFSVKNDIGTWSAENKRYYAKYF